MGSYGRDWLECAYCRKQGKCIDEVGVPRLRDVDPVGPLCDPCFDRAEPPHFRKYGGLLPEGLPEKVVDHILEFAFQVCHEHGSGYLFRQAMSLSG